MPLLYASLSGGRVLAVIFFLCITLAGISSLISIMEQSVHVLEDFGGIEYLYATIEIANTCHCLCMGTEVFLAIIDSLRTLEWM